MRAYFTDAGITYAYDDPRTDPSYQELYKIYNPSKKSLTEALKAQKRERQEIFVQRDACRDSLARTVPFKDLEICVALVGAALWMRRLEQLEQLIALNEGMLRTAGQKSRAAEVIAIPITDFLQFNKMGWARCPFHGDSKPSMKYYKRDNRVHCFSGCGQKNVIQIVAELRGITTREAFKQLAQSLV